MESENNGKMLKISFVEFEDRVECGKIRASGHKKMLQVIGLFAKSKNAKTLLVEIDDLGVIPKLHINHEAGSIVCYLPNNGEKIIVDSATLKSLIDYTKISGTLCDNVLYIINEFAESEEACTLTLKDHKGRSIVLKRESKSLTYFTVDGSEDE